MSLPRRPRAAIFDLDGVLLNTEPLYTQATQQIAQRHGKQFTWELKRQTMGGDAVMGARLVLEALELPMTVHEYLDERLVLLEKLFESAPAMPGVERWIELLQSRGLRVAVGTSSIRPLCEIKWATHPWLRQLDPKVCGDDPEVKRRKPAPDIFLIAASRLGVAPTECVVFEDSPAGVSAARAAGMQVIAIKAEELDRSFLEHADVVVDGYHQLSLETLGL